MPVASIRASGGKNVIFQMAPNPFLSILICSTRYQCDILKVFWKKLTRTYPLGASDIEIFHSNKSPILHAILSHFCIHQRTCIWDFLSIHFSFYTLLKDVCKCKVLGCDSNAKWFVGAMTGVGSNGSQIASNLLANYYEWLQRYIHTIYNFWSMGTFPMYEWKVHVKCWGMIFYHVVRWATV